MDGQLLGWLYPRGSETEPRLLNQRVVVEILEELTQGGGTGLHSRWARISALGPFAEGLTGASERVGGISLEQEYIAPKKISPNSNRSQPTRESQPTRDLSQ